MKKYVFIIIPVIVIVAIGGFFACKYFVIHKNQSTNDILPSIISISPAAVSMNRLNKSPIAIGTDIVIKGQNFGPLGGYVGNEWISNPHTFVWITNSGGKSVVLWAGNEPDITPTPITNYITVNIPSEVCVNCNLYQGFGRMTIVPGDYLIQLKVDGRGSSNIVPLTITSL